MSNSVPDQSFCPSGTTESSPALQCRVNVPKALRPGGTLELTTLDVAAKPGASNVRPGRKTWPVQPGTEVPGYSLREGPSVRPFGVDIGNKACGLEPPGWRSHPSYSSRGLARHERHPRIFLPPMTIPKGSQPRHTKGRNVRPQPDCCDPSGIGWLLSFSGGIARGALNPRLLWLTMASPSSDLSRGQAALIPNTKATGARPAFGKRPEALALLPRKSNCPPGRA